MQTQVDGRAILVMLKTNVHDHTVYHLKLNELRTLIETMGIKVIGNVVQSRHRPFAKYHIGSGKVKEIAKKARRHNVNIIVFYNLLRSSQKLNLIQALGVDVVDRYEVTLEIFNRMASDTLSQLQIEAARLEKLAPYFKLEANLRFHNDRPFFRSMGEYAFHSQMRELTRRQAANKRNIEKLLKEKRERIRKRRRLGYPTICVAGYYNAGKTSLFNAITGDNKPVSDKPFTTLSSKYQRRFVDYETTLLFIDTIGFVIDLNPRLIKSFELNLEDLRSADMVILLLDATDALLILRIKIAEGIRLLSEMDIPREKILIVFNKIDLNPAAVNLGKELNLERKGLPWTTVSAKERTNLNELLMTLKAQLIRLAQAPEAKDEYSIVQ
ncbi:MAG: 50S ribosome-binding GTPase [Candidatus Bathyarchaeota archaeon]|nr:50S ribosome-binding GTPase [Candidatus Bathyarchaeota archaeon]MDP7443668.1 50S ribosome-binding GTPase [Candidatus Bathyarchaeota archaeon]